MAWKGVHISQPAQLNLERGQIVVTREDGAVTLPMEDVAYLVLDVPHATLTSTLLSACMAAGIPIVATDERHIPNGVMLPFHTHHRQAAVAARQITASEPFRKRCWQRIVAAKIANQAAHLETRVPDAGGALAAMARRVGSGDPENVEARAARAYWSALFDGFIRDNPEDLRNKLLNYGYAVVRAGVARALVAHGFLPCLGLHHASQTNAFNLADDLVEPLRPFVDALAWQRADGRDPAGDLDIEDRRAMAGVLTETCETETGRQSLLHASETMAASLLRAVEGASPALLQLPVFSIR